MNQILFQKPATSGSLLGRVSHLVVDHLCGSNPLASLGGFAVDLEIDPPITHSPGATFVSGCVHHITTPFGEQW